MTSFPHAPFHTRYHSIRRGSGQEEAKRTAAAHRAAIEALSGTRVPAYLLTEKRRYVAELKTEAVAAREAGLDVQWTDQVPVPFATRGAIVYRDAVAFDPAEAGGSMNVLAFAYPREHPEGIFRDTADQPHYFTWIDTPRETLLVVMGEEDRETLQAYVRERFGDLESREGEWRRERDSNPR